MPKHAIIIGNGLAGALLAVLLAKDGWRVSVYERRGDPRAAEYQGGRSINLALSARGLAGLAAAGLEQRVRDRDIIPMPGRMMHAPDGTLTFQPYSKNPSDAINSVSRGGLNLTLLTAAAECPGVEFFFAHPCVDADLASGEAIFQTPDGRTVRATADLIIGADGAFSALRSAMLKTDRFEYSQSYLGHGYKELHIPPRTVSGASDTPFALEPHALHIWPRGGAMMIALPNRDGSFTCTLFWPFSGGHSFESLETVNGAAPSEADRERIVAFFRQHYADAVPLMPTLAEDFFRNPTSSLVTIRCFPWHHAGKFVLAGDAAHALVPFYGQGINCGFEDCVELAACLRRFGDQREALEAYQMARKANADAISEMAVDNFTEMRDKVGQPEFLYRKKIEQTLHALFPARVEPQYNLVSFSTVPYTLAQSKGRELQRVIDQVAAKLPANSLSQLGEAAWVEKIKDAGSEALRRSGSVHASEPAAATSPTLIDITPALTPTIGVWPGDTKFERQVLCDLKRGDNITLSTLRTTVHLGAHADGPNHYGKDARGVGEQPLHHYIGPCHVIRATAARATRITPADIQGGLEQVRHPRVLIASGTFPDFENWNEDFAALSVELIDALAARGVITIGVDTPSVDLQNSKDLPAHQAFLRHDIAILEGLALATVEPGEYELLAQPLKLMGFDGSPIRAVLRR